MPQGLWSCWREQEGLGPEGQRREGEPPGRVCPGHPGRAAPQGRGREGPPAGENQCCLYLVNRYGRGEHDEGS